MRQVQSQLSRYQPTPATSDAALKAMGARAWEDEETLVVRLSQVSDPIIQQMVRAIAASLFGTRPT